MRLKIANIIREIDYYTVTREKRANKTSSKTQIRDTHT